MTVACFGEALIVLVQVEPGPLEDATTFSRSMGGAETNVAIALAASGTESSVVTRVGNDGFGRYIVRSLATFGVEVDAIDVDTARPTGMYLKELGGSSASEHDLGVHVSRMHYYRAGSASSAMTPAMLETPAVARALANAAIVHTTGITPALSCDARDTQAALVAQRRAGQLVSFDVNWRSALWRGREAESSDVLGSFVSSSDIALLGSDEAHAVFGASEPAELRRLFPEPRWLVVKDDQHAAVGFDGQRRVDVSPGAVDVVEAIGAGDAFAAGLLAGFAAGVPLDASMQRAHATAARALESVHDHVGAAL